MNYSTTCNQPRIIAGDFNSVLNVDDRVGGNPITWPEIVDFHHCVDTYGLIELPYVGQRYTWNDRNSSGQGIFSKIDWVFINNEWLDTMPLSKTYVPSESISDHSPVKITFLDEKPRFKRFFQFCNVWATLPQFKDKVEVRWNVQIHGCNMLQVVRRLKLLKRELGIKY